MASYHEIQQILPAPIEEVLLKLYLAPFYRWLYETSLRGLAQAYPEALPQREPVRRSQADKAPTKDHLVDLLLAVLRNREIGRRFLATLPGPTRQALEALTWTRRANLESLEETIGEPIALLNPEAGRFVCLEPFLVQPQHGFLVLLPNAEENYWDHYARRGSPQKSDYSVTLPAAMRRAFKTLVPPPPGHKLSPLDDPPEFNGLRYSCAAHIHADLRVAAEYIAQGHLKRTKSKQIAASSIRAVHQLTGEREFYPNTDDTDLALSRAGLLVGGMAVVGAKEREKLLARPESAEPARDLFEKLLAWPAFLHEELLGHLCPRRNRSCDYHAPSARQLLAFFGAFPAGKWLSWENIQSYHRLREIQPSLFGPGTHDLLARAESEVADARSRSYPSEPRVNADNDLELVGEPLLKGFAFLLAAFGLMEIAYVAPANPVYRRPRKNYLSPFDGLRYARLTPFGEYVFRQRDTFEVPSAAAPAASILLDDTRLLATCRNPDRLTQMALAQFMEPLGPGCFRMTSTSFLAGCRSRQDIDERIRLFRRAVSATPPAVWETFFARILARVAPLRPEPDLVVYRVDMDEEIRRHIATDPVLRELVLKVEGLRIAVRHADLQKLAERLEHFGYLSPVPGCS